MKLKYFFRIVSFKTSFIYKPHYNALGLILIYRYKKYYQYLLFDEDKNFLLDIPGFLKITIFHSL